MKILRPDADPAYQLRRFRVCLALMRQDNRRSGRWHGFLLAQPEYRRFYEEVRAIERAVQWRYFEWTRR